MSLPSGGNNIPATASGTITAYRIIKQTTAEMTGIEANAGEAGWGVSQEGVATGKQFAIRTMGYTYVQVADASANAGARMKSDNDGKATAASTNHDEIVVTLLKPVTAADQIVAAEITKFTLSAT